MSGGSPGLGPHMHAMEVKETRVSPLPVPSQQPNTTPTQQTPQPQVIDLLYVNLSNVHLILTDRFKTVTSRSPYITCNRLQLMWKLLASKIM